MKTPHIKTLLAVAATLSVAASSHAATITKDTTGTDLTAGASWIGAVAPTSADVVTWSTGSLGGTLSLNQTNTTAQSWGGIDIQSATADITIGTTTLGNATAFDMGVNSITVANAAGLSVGSTISGTGIAANTTVTAINGNVLTLSANTNAANTGTAISVTAAPALTLGSAGITIADAAKNLTFTNSVIFSGATSNVTVGTGRTLFLNGVKTFNAGTTTTLNGAGTVEIGASQNSTGAGDVVLNSGTLFMNMQGGTHNRTGSTTINGGVVKSQTSLNFFGTGTVYLNGGSIAASSGRRVWNNSFVIGGDFGVGVTGSTNAIQLTGNVDLGGASRQVTVTSILELNGTGGNGTLVKQGAGNLVLGAVNLSTLNISLAAGPMVLGGNGTSQIGNLSGVAGTTISTNYNLSSDGLRTLSVNQTVDGAYAGTIGQGSTARALSFIKNGSANLTLSGTNTYTGTTTVNAGTLIAGNASAFGTGAVTVNGGALNINGQTLGNAITLAGGALAGNGTLSGMLTAANLNSSTNLTLSNAANALTGTTTVTAGTLTAGSSGAFGGSAIAVNGGALNLNGQTLGNAITLAGGALAGNGTLNGVLTATDLSTSTNLTLGNAANALTGTTTVTAGTLTAGSIGAFGGSTIAVNGGALNLGGYGVANTISVGASGKLIGASNQSLANVSFADGAALTGSFGAFNAGTSSSKVYNVTGGATFSALSGQGTFTGGSVTVTDTLAIGNSPGLITVNGDTTLTDTTVSTFEIGGLARGTAYDALSVTGTLTLDGTIRVVTDGIFDTRTLTEGATFDLLDWGTIDATGFNIVSDLDLNGLALGDNLGWDTSKFLTDGTISVVVTAVPEPSTYGLMGAGALAAVAFVRRRRRLAVKAA